MSSPIAKCDYLKSDFANAELISIRVSLRGAIQRFAAVFQTKSNFNSRTPCEVRRKRGENLQKLNTFQFAHPLARCDCRLDRFKRNSPISIRAPLARCDT